MAKLYENAAAHQGGLRGDRPAPKFYLVPGVIELQKRIMKSQEVTKTLLAVSQGVRQLEIASLQSI